MPGAVVVAPGAVDVPGAVSVPGWPSLAWASTCPITIVVPTGRPLAGSVISSRRPLAWAAPAASLTCSKNTRVPAPAMSIWRPGTASIACPSTTSPVAE